MKKINEIYRRTPRPIRIVQFGEGGFLRGFADYMIDVANEKGVFDGGVAIVKPHPGDLGRFRAQDNLYTVLLRGLVKGKPYTEKRVVTCVQKAVDPYGEYGAFMDLAKLGTLRFVISNTTEAGIVFDGTDRFDLTPPKTYPGKLTKFLYARFQAFRGSAEGGLIVLPSELIEDNGKRLRECVLRFADLWELGAEFERWVKEDTVFCGTLVDRIMTGYPKTQVEKIWGELGYEDDLLDVGEPFALWVIESEKDISAEFPLDKAGMQVVFTKDARPYRERKVRILNGTHTATALAEYLMGWDIVRDCIRDPLARRLMETVLFEEIVPTVKLPHQEAADFANAVLERFANPFVDHALLSISLDSVSKWKARLLPVFRDDYAKTGALPKCLAFSLAALMAFYTSDRLEKNALIGDRGGQPYEIRDERNVLEFFAANSRSKPAAEFVKLFLSNEAFWGEDLTAEFGGLAELVTKNLEAVRRDGMKKTVEALLQRRAAAGRPRRGTRR